MVRYRERREKAREIRENVRESIAVGIMSCEYCTYHCVIKKSLTDLCQQTITGEMSTLRPPVELEDPRNESRLEYIQGIADVANFAYPDVGPLSCPLFKVTPKPALSISYIGL